MWDVEGSGMVPLPNMVSVSVTIIIALAAFSTAPNTMLATIQSSFRRPAGSSTEWRLHGRVGEGGKYE
jgi:hypothetical protein